MAVLALLLVAPPACSSSSHGSADGGDGATGGDVAGNETAPVDDAAESDATDGAPPALTCQGARLCLAAGGTPEGCSAKASDEARAAFQKLLDCLTLHCADLAAACVCRESCQQPDGYCLDETDACVPAATTADPVCGQYCGG